MAQTFTFELDGPYSNEFLDELAREVELLLPRILQAKREREQEMYELLVDMLS